MCSQAFICCGALLLIMEIKEGGGLKMDFKAKFLICKNTLSENWSGEWRW